MAQFRLRNAQVVEAFRVSNSRMIVGKLISQKQFDQEYISVGPAPAVPISTPKSSEPDPGAPVAPHWEGDSWVDGTYRVERRWVTKYPHLYGPDAVDPDHGSGDIECNDAMTKFIGGTVKKIIGIEETGGLYSTWSERHCAETALYIGYIDVESTADIPPVPKFWLGEAQYWFPHVLIGRLVRKMNITEFLKNPKVWAIIGGAVTAGYALLPTFLKAFGA